MNRRSFIKLAGMAAGALGLASRVAPATNATPNPDMAHSFNSYTQPPKGLPMHVMGDGSGKLWILDPTCPPDQIFGFSPRDFGYQGDAKMYEAFARLEFEQVKYWPRSARITGINAEISDAL
jgi:hypothetical protein